MQLVVFDAYGTLWDVAQIARRCQTLVGVERAEPFFQLWRDKQLEYAFLRTVMRQYAPFDAVTRQALDYALEHFALSLPTPQISQLMDAWYEPVAFDDARAALSRLRGCERLILSNGSPQMLDLGVARTQMEDLVDRVLSVDRSRHFKPHPKAYQLVLDHYPVAPHEVVFVSSNGWDIAGAGYFGYRTVWINRRQIPVEQLGIRPDAILPNLQELVRWVADQTDPG